MVPDFLTKPYGTTAYNLSWKKFNHLPQYLIVLWNQFDMQDHDDVMHAADMDTNCPPLEKKCCICILDSYFTEGFHIHIEKGSYT